MKDLRKTFIKSHKGNVYKKCMARLKIALTDNIKEVSANDSISVFKQEYDNLIKDGWVLNDFNGENSGIFGEFAYRSGKEPTIYLREIYHFTKKGGYHTCIVVEHKYDMEGNIVTQSYRKYDDYTGRELRNELVSENIPSIIDHGSLLELSGITTYNDAKAEVKSLQENQQAI